jgi:hypothetical protein
LTAGTTRTTGHAATAPASSPRPRRRGRTVALAAGGVVIGGLASLVVAWNRSTTHPVSIDAARRHAGRTQPPPIGPPHQLASKPWRGQVRRCSRVTLLPSRTDQVACRCRNNALRLKRSRRASDDRDGDAFQRNRHTTTLSGRSVAGIGKRRHRVIGNPSHHALNRRRRNRRSSSSADMCRHTRLHLP